MSDKSIDQYLKEANAWDIDRESKAAISEKRAWKWAGFSLSVAVLEAIALYGLTPLKTVVPLPIRVDSSTGIVDVINKLKDGETTYDEVVNKYFSQWYVRYREGYSHELATEFYNNVGWMSSQGEQQSYYNWFNPKNPMSPLNIYGDKSKVKVKVKGTTFINNKTALVRYYKETYRQGDMKPEISHWAATITFSYTGLPMTEKAREVNPLGFQVSEYRNDPESTVEQFIPPVIQPVKRQQQSVQQPIQTMQPQVESQSVVPQQGVQNQ